MAEHRVMSDLAELNAFSARLGSDFTRTQGAGGNTSIKIGGTMWVKASGTWLAHAVDREIMVPLAVAPLAEALDSGDLRAESATDFVLSDLNPSGLRPSIEASVHATIPQSIVAHFHCVNTLAHAVCVEGEVDLKAIFSCELPELTWAMIPYRRPGTPLARAIAATRDAAPDVLVLANHGLVVCGETVAEVSQRVEAVTKALSLPRRAVSNPDLDFLQNAVSRLKDYALPEHPTCHDIATDEIGSRIAQGGSLYPDHVIFLGTDVGLLDENGSVAEVSDDGEKPKLLLAPGKGVLVRNDLTAGGQAMVQCLAEVVTRIGANKTPRFLSAADEYELTHWEAEQYRQTLDRQAARG